VSPPRIDAATLVLLVDDDRRTSFRLAQMLREDGFDVEVARDGAAAIARLGRSPVPDVLVTDFQLPHADGLAVARYARSRAPRLHVVVITGYPELVDGKPESIDPPPTVFTKPIDYDALRQALSKTQLLR
jgi:two-component system response regulator MprA